MTAWKKAQICPFAFLTEWRMRHHVLPATEAKPAIFLGCLQERVAGMEASAAIYIAKEVHGQQL